MRKIYLILILFLPVTTIAQDPTRFEEELEKFKSNTNTYDIVFTGSSSVRLWKSLQSDFPEVNLINTGFGGSHMSDLDYHLEDLVLKFKPSKVFIYEGDNDINSGKSGDVVISQAMKIIQRILEQDDQVRIYLISAKPSPSRFHHKEEYEALNDRFWFISEENDQVEYINIWTPMLNNNEKPIANIFIEDQLHMNSKGYKIWAEVIGNYVD